MVVFVLIKQSVQLKHITHTRQILHIISFKISSWASFILDESGSVDQIILLQESRAALVCVKTEYKWKIIPICKYENDFTTLTEYVRKRKSRLKIFLLIFTALFYSFNSMNCYITYKKSLYLFL